MALNTTQSAQLTTTTTTGGNATATATTGENATTAATPVWDTETFGLGTSTAAEERQEDEYDTNEYFKTYDGEWYSKKELEEAIWEKFKDVYNWKHMRGSTANAIHNDVYDIIEGLKSGDLTISGGLLYTVKGSKNHDTYSSWKSKYEGNKPHHANSKYDSDAKNNAAWVVMNAFRTLTDEDTKKKSLQESASTSSLAALKQELSGSMLLSLGIPDPSDLSNWYDIDALDESTLTRGTAHRLEKILGWLNDIGDEYSQKDLKKEYGLNDKQLNQFKSDLSSAYKAIQDGTIDAGDYNALDGLNRFLGMTLKWSDLLKTEFGSDEWKADQANKRKQEEEEAELKAAEEAYNNFRNSIYLKLTSTSPLGLVPSNRDIVNKQNCDKYLLHRSDDELIKIIKGDWDTDLVTGFNITNNDVKILALKQAYSRGLLQKTGSKSDPNEYYVPYLNKMLGDSDESLLYVVSFNSNGYPTTYAYRRITDIPALEEHIKKVYETNNGRWSWDKFKEVAGFV